MYREFYGLTDRPFSKTPDPRFLYPSNAHEEALARLQYAVEERDLIILTGDVGCGKTTLTRALIDSFDESYRVILIINPRLTPSQFLRIVAKRYGIDPGQTMRDDLLDAIYEKVFEDYQMGITPVIIIDEAQLIPNIETFEEIRLLTNFQLDDMNLLSLVLVGQTDLRERIKRKEFLPLRQRIGLFYHIGPLGRSDVSEYIKHRLAVAGRRRPLFTDKAIDAVYRYSGGVPRVINTLCTMALLEGLCKESSIVDAQLIRAAAKEVGLDDNEGIATQSHAGGTGKSAIKESPVKAVTRQIKPGGTAGRIGITS